MSTTEIESKVKELREYERLAQEANEAADSIKDEIKAIMGAQEELRAGEYRVTWTPVTSQRLDAKGLRAALPDVAARFTTTTTTRRFCVA